ncbi:alpha/beta hydrolase family protein [Streptomyces sp. NPDC004041]|uniref:alpha/beta hydrolase family protein n=1 Tax=Streptomyces sp. NPDC004041 TaxID=3364688 RepID=UPI0036778DB0
MSLWEILAVLCAAALALTRWLPARVRRRASLVAAAAVIATTAVVLALGARWQMVPVLAGAGVVLLLVVVALLRQRAGRPVRRLPWWMALPGTAAVLAVIAAGPLAAWALPTPVFPEPAGRFAVGTTVMEWSDPERPETFTAAPDDRRTVPVQLWYPARPGRADGQPSYNGARTPQEAAEVQNALADSFGIPRFLVSDVARARTAAVFDAPVAPGAGRFPVIVFSPGLSGVRTSNTVLAQEWASRGYVVATLDHPYDAALTFVDGRPVRSRNKETVTEDRRKEARYVKDNVDLRAADFGFVLDQLERLDRGEIAGPLAGRLDTRRAAAVGHSRGGAAALAAARDSRYRAVVNIDGGLRDAGVRPFGQPALAITSPVSVEENADYVPDLDRVLGRGEETNYRLDIPGTGHLSFTDAALYFPPLPSLVGTVGRSEGLRVTADATTAFLDSALRGRASGLPGLLRAYGDLTVYE